MIFIFDSLPFRILHFALGGLGHWVFGVTDSRRNANMTS